MGKQFSLRGNDNSAVARGNTTGSNPRAKAQSASTEGWFVEWDHQASLPRTTTRTPPTRWTSGSTPLRRNTLLSFHHAFPRSYAGRQRIGEAAGRSLFPCFPQVDADAMVWLHSPHDPPRASLHLRSRSDARRHTCPATSSAFRLLSRVGEGDIPALRCELTGSCSSTFQYFSLGNHLGVTASPQSPFTCGLRHPAS